jgi:serine/threonine protein phosphatase PrpC
MPFVTKSITHLGGREENEDFCDHLELNDAACWIVADGLGGHRGGETASKIAVQAVKTSFQSNPELSALALQGHLEAAENEIRKVRKETPALLGMRTTIVVLITDFHHVLWAHVGDSRLYHLVGGKIAHATEDHSVVAALVKAGDIPADEMRHHEDSNRLLRSLGNADRDLQPAILPKRERLYRETALLLCTDGFWQYVTEVEMEVDLAKAKDPEVWLSRMEKRLIERAPEGSDNYTATAIFFDSETAPPPPKPKTDSTGGTWKKLMGRRVKIGSFLFGVVIFGVSYLAAPWIVGRLSKLRHRAASVLSIPRGTKDQTQELRKDIDDLKSRITTLQNEVDDLKRQKRGSAGRGATSSDAKHQ